jgi:hypothetical protein
MLSRPNNVMNHGAPAATNGRTPSIRSAPRSFSVRRNTSVNAGSVAVIVVFAARQFRSRRAGRVSSSGWPAVNRVGTAGSATITSVVQRVRAGMTTCQLSSPGAVVGFSVAVTEMSRSGPLATWPCLTANRSAKSAS